MSWAQHAPGSAIILQPSDVESRRFGLSISRLLVPFGVTDGDWRPVATMLDDSAADVVFLRIPVERISWVNRMAARGSRDLLLADTLTYWLMSAADVDHRARPSRPTDIESRPVVDVDEALALMETVFAGYANHYAANPLFDTAVAQVAYAEWMRTLMRDLPAQGLYDQSGMIAVVVGEVVDGLGVLVVGGVRPDRREKGLFSVLLDALIDQLRGAGARDVVLSTQGHHIPTQRTAARMGFLPVGELLTVHAVRPGLLPQDAARL